MAIIISKNGKNAKRIDKGTIDKEDYLQKYIYDNPESIPIYEISEDIKVLILGREVPTNSGPIDAFGIDRNGDIYIIETKLYKNPDKRQVVAQVLDYGASLWKHNTNFEGFLSMFQKESRKQFEVSVEDRIRNYFGIDEEEVATVIENFERNLNDGNFKFVVLMDKLHSRLKDLILFLNQNSQFDIFAVELEYYKFNEYEILIPKLFGAEVKKDVGVAKKRTGNRRTWNEEEYCTEIKKLENKYQTAIMKLYEFSKKYSDKMNFGTGNARGSFNPRFYKVGPRSLFSVYTDGELTINIGWFSDENSLTAIEKYYHAIKSIKNFKLSDRFSSEWIFLNKENWCEKVDQFIEITKKFV